MSQKNYKKLELNIKKRLSADFLGSYKTAFKGSGLIFRDLREYVFGDSVKSIDWKTSAKHADLYVKNYEEERDLKILFVLDITKSMFFASKEKTKLDLLIDVFYTLSLSAQENTDKVGAFIYNGMEFKYIDFKSGDENIFRILKEIDLLSLNTFKKEKINIEVLKKIENLKIRNSLIFILSDKLDYEKTIFNLLGVENEIIYINLFDRFENNLLEENVDISFKFGNSFLNIFTGDDKKREEYIALRKKKLDSFKLNLKKSHIDYLCFDTETDIFRELLLYFKNKLV